MYNVVARLEEDEELTDEERRLYESAACGVLRDLHTAVDELTARCYGWPWPLTDREILERLVALHDERLREERHGQVRWLRPDYQIARLAPGEFVEQADMLPDSDAPPSVVEPEIAQWPESAVEQLASVKASVSVKPGDAKQVTKRFRGAKKG